MLAINPIPAFSDNYLWLIEDGTSAVIVDPGDAAPVRKYLQEKKLNLVAILITHHHADHIGGVEQLRNQYNCVVYGPKNDPVGSIDYSLSAGDEFTIDALSLSFSVLFVPGHTLGHIAYFSAATEFSVVTSASTDNAPLLFCGDTLFSGGCGRLFEGTPAQMWDSLSRLSRLPAATKIFCAHEYTLANLKFANAVEPQNQALQDYEEKAKSLRSQGVPTLPSTIDVEKQINPFLRADKLSVQKAAQSRANKPLETPEAVFAEIRRWKDHF